MACCCNISITLKIHFAAQSVKWPGFINYGTRATPVMPMCQQQAGESAPIQCHS
jgi:hypothetical protein